MQRPGWRGKVLLEPEEMEQRRKMMDGTKLQAGEREKSVIEKKVGVGGVYMQVADHFIPLFQEVMELVMLLMARRIIQTPLPPGCGRCFSGIELNYPFSTRGPVCDLFLSHSYAPPPAAHGGSSGQGQRCGSSTLSALLFAAEAQSEGGGGRETECSRQEFP